MGNSSAEGVRSSHCNRRATTRGAAATSNGAARRETTHGEERRADEDPQSAAGDPPPLAGKAPRSPPVIRATRCRLFPTPVKRLARESNRAAACSATRQLS
jgi:hypothetical protein